MSKFLLLSGQVNFLMQMRYFVHSSADEQYGLVHILALVSTTSLNNGVQIALLFVFSLFVGPQIQAHKLFLTVLEAVKSKVKTQALVSSEDLHTSSLHGERDEEAEG